MQIKIRSGQREKLLRKLEAIRKEERHTLTGSIARYVLLDRVSPDTVTLWLVWKDSEMPTRTHMNMNWRPFEQNWLMC